MSIPKINTKVRAAQLNLEGLLKLLGGNADDRLKFWGIVKGITTPAQFKLVSRQLDIMANSAKQIQAGVKVIQKTAKTAAKG